NLARPLAENDRLIEQVVAFQLAADEMDLRPHQLQQLQAILAWSAQLVEVAPGLIQQPRGFAKVGLGEAGQPCLEIARVGLTEGQPLAIRRRYAQQQWLTQAFQTAAPVNVLAPASRCWPGSHR